MRQPILPVLGLLCAAVAASYAGGGSTQSQRATPRAPRAIRDKACTEGAYVRRRPAPRPAAAAPARRDAPAAGEETGGLFGLGFSAASDSGDDGVQLFTPSKDKDCASFDALFTAGPDGATPADGLEIAPAMVDGKLITPAEAQTRFRSLGALNRLERTDSTAIRRFFEGGADAGELAALDAKLAPLNTVADASAAAHPFFLNDGGGRTPLWVQDPARRRPAVGSVPDPKATYPELPPALKPKPRSVFSPIGDFFSDIGNEINDIRHNGGTMSREEGSYIPFAGAIGRMVSNPGPSAAPDPRDMGPDASINVDIRNQGRVGYTTNCEPGCFGTQRMIDVLVTMGKRYEKYTQGQRKLAIGGISKPGGGPFPPHVSHRKGIDTDISFQGGARGFDPLANAMIVAAGVKTMPTFVHVNGQSYILCDQSTHARLGWGLDQLTTAGIITAEEATRGKSLLTHWENHRDHFHFRIFQNQQLNTAL